MDNKIDKQIKLKYIREIDGNNINLIPDISSGTTYSIKILLEKKEVDGGFFDIIPYGYGSYGYGSNNFLDAKDLAIGLDNLL